MKTELLRKILGKGVVVCAVLACGVLCAPSAFAGMIFDGDGSDEPGFVPPPERKLPPPPPANIAGAETLIPYPPPPAQPQSRSEKKKPPRPPVMFTKLTSAYGPLDWNARPNDLNNLLKALKEMVDVDYDYDSKSFAEVDADPEKNPILYRTGHFHWTLSDAEKEKLRAYLLNGGTLILNAGMGSKPFYDSALKVMAEVLPEAPVQRLNNDHAIFHSYYDIGQVKYRKGVRAMGYTGYDPWIEGATVDCRTVCFISRFGMETGWDPLPDEDILAYASDSACKLGMNILSYATTMQSWARQTARKITYVDSENVTSAASMNIGQVIYDGEWKTRHTALSLLLREFNRKTKIPVKFARRELRLTDSALADTPVLYMTGHDYFKLSSTDVAALRNYLENGGLLIGEACCGRAAFQKGFQDMMAQVMPDTKGVAIPKNDPLYTQPNRITELQATEALRQISGPRVSPELYLWSTQGHPSVIYSPKGLAGGWELSSNPYSIGYTDSLPLGENILMYAITR